MTRTELNELVYINTLKKYNKKYNKLIMFGCGKYDKFLDFKNFTDQIEKYDNKNIIKYPVNVHTFFPHIKKYNNKYVEYIKALHNGALDSKNIIEENDLLVMMSKDAGNGNISTFHNKILTDLNKSVDILLFTTESSNNESPGAEYYTPKIDFFTIKK